MTDKIFQQELERAREVFDAAKEGRPDGDVQVIVEDSAEQVDSFDVTVKSKRGTVKFFIHRRGGEGLLDQPDPISYAQDLLQQALIPRE